MKLHRAPADHAPAADPRIAPVVETMRALVRDHVEDYQSDLEHDLAALSVHDPDEPFLWAHRRYGTELLRPVATHEMSPFLSSEVNVAEAQRAAVAHWNAREHGTRWYFYAGALRTPVSRRPYTFTPVMGGRVRSLHDTYLVSDYREYRRPDHQITAGDRAETVVEVYDGTRHRFVAHGCAARSIAELGEMVARYGAAQVAP